MKSRYKLYKCKRCNSVIELTLEGRIKTIDNTHSGSLCLCDIDSLVYQIKSTYGDAPFNLDTFEDITPELAEVLYNDLQNDSEDKTSKS